MGEFRDYRLTIPGAIVLLVAGATICVFADPDIRTVFSGNAVKNGTPNVNLEGTAAVVSACIAFVVGSFAVGYICSVLTILLLAEPPGWFLWTWFGRSLKSLEKELEPVLIHRSTPKWKLLNPWSWVQGWRHARRRKYEVLAEAHLRLHGHASKELLDFSTRRLTAMFVAWNSTFAVIAGHNLGCFLSWLVLPTWAAAWWWTLLLLCLVAVLFAHGRIAARQQWDVFCKFMVWDVITHPPNEAKR